MKTLIALGVGIALGFAFKKTAKTKKPKIVVVDDCSPVGKYLFSDEAKEVFRKHLKAHKPSV